MAPSNRTDTDRANAHKIALAATLLCAFVIAATLLPLSSAIQNHAPMEDVSRLLRIQRHPQHDTTAVKTAMEGEGESHPTSSVIKSTASRIIQQRKTRRLQESPTTLLQCPTQPNNDDNDNNNNDGRPKPKLPSLPNLLSTSTYAASFPGSGNKLLTKHLVESISGMLVGDASTSPSLERMKVQKMDRTGFARGQMEVIALRTYHPHPDPTEGKLSAWDDFLTRAFVVLRNPMYAIPAYFDGMYQTKTHNLPSSSSSSSSSSNSNNDNNDNNDNNNSEEMDEDTALWIKWRDDQFSIQLQHYRNFVSYWMERYGGHDDRRVFFSYEGLISEDTGVAETMRLASFLEGGIRANVVDMVLKGTAGNKVENSDGSGIAIAIDDSMYAEALESFATVEEVPCVWKDIVHATILSSSSLDGGEASSSSATAPRGLGGLSEGAQSSTDWRRRPFTPENLVEMSKVLLEMMEMWNEHRRLLSILSGYQQEVTDHLKAVLYP